MENINNSMERPTLGTMTQSAEFEPSSSDSVSVSSPTSVESSAGDDAADIGSSGCDNDIAQQDKKLLQALDDVLEKHNRRRQAYAKATRINNANGFGDTVTKNGVGFLSLSLVLMFFGVMLLYTLFSPKHDFYFLLKLSPICLVLVGLEIFFSNLITKGKFKLHIPSILVSSLMVIACCVMCLAFNETFNEKNNDYNNRSMEAEIYDLSYRQLNGKADIAKLDVKVDLNPVNIDNISGPDALSTDDYIDITVTLSGIIETPKDFAVICKSIIDTYKRMGISVTNFYFINESTLHTYNLKVEGKFAQDLTAAELEQLVGHILLRDMDYIQDLEDLTDES